MVNEIRDVLVVGGGDAGLLTGIAIRQMNPDVDVSVVDDFDRDIPTVGKATFREITGILHGSLDIDEQRFVSEVKPVWKASAYFRDWCGYASFHYPFDIPKKYPSETKADAIEGYYHWYDERYADPDHLSIGEEIADRRKSPWYLDPNQGSYTRYDDIAYHLDTNRFNTFLRDLCRERGVSLLNDAVVEVEVTDGHVDRIRSSSQAYEADLYVDATGFNRLLRGEQDASFREFDVPLDAAYTTQVDLAPSDIVPATVLDTGSHGWFWQIDTYDHRDLGYVFASEFVSDDEARATFVEHFDDEPFTADDVTKYTFDSGYYERPIVDNCVAMGNAVGFIEPLQAPALTTHAKAAVRLASLLSSHGQILDDWLRETFNSWLIDYWDSIYDFISIHYAYSSGDNEFWQAMQSIDLSPRVRKLIDDFDRFGFDRTVDPTANHPESGPLQIFHPLAFYYIMRHMGAESEFYEENEFEVSEEFRAEKAKVDDAVTEHVKEYLTTEEMYESVVSSW